MVHDEAFRLQAYSHGVCEPFLIFNSQQDVLNSDITKIKGSFMIQEQLDRLSQKKKMKLLLLLLVD